MGEQRRNIDDAASGAPSLVEFARSWIFHNMLRVSEALIRRVSTDGRRVYFDPSEFSWVSVLEEEWRGIRAELDDVLRSRADIPSFQDVSEEQRAITQDDRWKVYVLSVFGTRIESNCARCPRTARLLSNIPGLRNAMFSILAPGKHIPEHRGPYAGLLRYHLALKVPAQARDCAIRVNGIERCWEEGRTMIFDDSYPHSVANKTGSERVVLFADFERPLPGLLGSLNRLMLARLARTRLAQRPIERFANGEI